MPEPGGCFSTRTSAKLIALEPQQAHVRCNGRPGRPSWTGLELHALALGGDARAGVHLQAHVGSAGGDRPATTRAANRWSKPEHLPGRSGARHARASELVDWGAPTPRRRQAPAPRTRSGRRATRHAGAQPAGPTNQRSARWHGGGLGSAGTLHRHTGEASGRRRGAEEARFGAGNRRPGLSTARSRRCRKKRLRMRRVARPQSRKRGRAASTAEQVLPRCRRPDGSPDLSVPRGGPGLRHDAQRSSDTVSLRLRNALGVHLRALKELIRPGSVSTACVQGCFHFQTLGIAPVTIGIAALTLPRSPGHLVWRGSHLEWVLAANQTVGPTRCWQPQRVPTGSMAPRQSFGSARPAYLWRPRSAVLAVPCRARR